MDYSTMTRSQLIEEIQALRERAAERNEMVLRTSMDGFWVIDSEGNILDVNDSYCSLVGYSRAELMSMNLRDVEALEAPDEMAKHIRQILDTGSHSFETRHRRKDGTVVDLEVSANHLTLDGGQVFTFFHDITERKTTEEALRASEESYRVLVENAHDAIVVVQDGIIKFFNTRTAEVSGYSDEELADSPITNLIHPYDLPWVLDLHVARLEGREVPSTYSYRIVHRDGSTIWVEINVVVIEWEGRPATLGFFSDITERKRAEEELRSERDFNKALIDASPTFFVAIDSQRKTMMMNKSMLTALGYSEEEVRGTDYLATFVPEREYQQGLQIFEEQLALGESTINENHVLTKNGEELLVEWHGRSITDPDGEFDYLFGIGIDITERKRVEEALKESEEVHRLVSENIPVVVYSALPDEHSTPIFVSGRASELTGYSAEQFLQNPELWQSIIHPEDSAYVLEELEEHRQDGTLVDVEYRIVTNGGITKWIREKATPALDENGEILRIDGFMEDITERKRAEQAERQQRVLAEALRDIAEVLNSTLDPDQVLDHILANVGRVVPHDAANIHLLDENAEATRIFRIRGYLESNLGAPALDKPYRLVDTPTHRQMMETRKPIAIPDTRADQNWTRFPETRWIRSYAGSPICLQDRVIGFLNLDSATLGFFAPSDAGRLQAFADQAAIAIENARLYEQLKRDAAELEQRVADRTRELSALYAVSAVASESLDLETTLQTTLERVLSAMGTQAGGIFLLEDGQAPPDAGESESEVLRLVAKQGIPPEIVAPVEWGTGLECEVIQHGEPVTSPDVVADPRVEVDVSGAGLGPYVGVPLRASDRGVGVLSVLKERGQPGFGDEEITLLASIGDQVGRVVESAWLRQQAEQAAVLQERQRLARELHDSVTQALYSATLLAETGRQAAAKGDLSVVESSVAPLGEVVQQALKEMRLLVYELRPPVLEEDGLLSALQQRLDAVEARAGIEARLLVEGPVELRASEEEGLYRIALEALNNALKHAVAGAVTVRIQAGDDGVELEVVDDGRGFDPTSAGETGGLGLITMQERAEKLGGVLMIDSALGQGTKVTLTVPLAGAPGGFEEANQEEEAQ